MGHISIGRRTLLAKTCVVCCFLEMADAFPITTKGYHDSYCRTCHNQKSSPGIRNHQQTALKGAVRHRRPWTVQDIARLEEMVSEGRTGPQMALALNRTVYAVYTMKQRLQKEQM